MILVPMSLRHLVGHRADRTEVDELVLCRRQITKDPDVIVNALLITCERLVCHAPLILRLTIAASGPVASAEALPSNRSREMFFVHDYKTQPGASVFVIAVAAVSD